MSGASESRGSAVVKWLAGVAATVVGAVLISLLTRPGGLLNPAKPAPVAQAILKIVDLQITDAHIGGSATADITVYNEGESTGESCSVWWYSGSDVGKQLQQGLEASQSAVSEDFGIRPKESKQIHMSSLVYTEPGVFPSYVQASCAGVNITSIEFHKNVNAVTGP